MDDSVNEPGTHEENPTPPPPAADSTSPIKKFFAPLVTAVAIGWKYVAIATKVLPFGKVFITFGSMILSVWFYAQTFGMPLAIGFVVSILVHEMGHVFFAWRQGVPVSAPLFIPGMGALILQKRAAGSAYHEALIGIGGPLFGTAAGLVSWAIYAATDNPLFLALAFITLFLNLFNMAPIYPLDGGWIVACMSPYLLVFGYILLIAGAVTGTIDNPMIYILVLLSIPRVIKMFKKGNADQGPVPTTRNQRWGMGAAYVSMLVLLTWCMGHLHLQNDTSNPPRSQSQVASR